MPKRRSNRRRLKRRNRTSAFSANGGHKRRLFGDTLRQRENLDSIHTAGGLDFLVVSSNAGSQLPVAGVHGDVLAPVDRIGDGGIGDGTGQCLIPQYLPSLLIERAQVVFQVAEEHQVAGGK